jgi:hypothetical protein
MSRKPISLPWLIQAIKSHDTDDCLMWPFGINEWGYGTIRFMDKTHLAHRVAFFITHVIWPNPIGMHTCDTPACVNPSHIIPGTDAENTRDAMIKGRLRCRHGEGVNTAVLSDEIVNNIRKEYIRGDGGEFGQCGLAKKYGVSQSTIGCIVRRKSWRHLP